jgi:hypothetical protein
MKDLDYGIEKGVTTAILVYYRLRFDISLNKKEKK